MTGGTKYGIDVASTHSSLTLGALEAFNVASVGARIQPLVPHSTYRVGTQPRAPRGPVTAHIFRMSEDDQYLEPRFTADRSTSLRCGGFRPLRSALLRLRCR